jgi:hypothetical protein
MQSSSIIPPQTEGIITGFKFHPEAILEGVRGGCYVSVISGSITFQQHKSEPLSVSGEKTPLDLEDKLLTSCIYFIESLLFDLITGEDVGEIILYYPPVTKKDGGTSGPEKKF